MTIPEQANTLVGLSYKNAEIPCRCFNFEQQGAQIIFDIILMFKR